MTVPNIPLDFWKQEHEQLAALVAPRLQGLAAVGIAQAERKLRAMGMYFDNAVAHQEAAAWARAHTEEILQQFETRTQGLVGDKIATWVETPGLKTRDLVEMLQPVLDGNVTRAYTVGVTETTRAFAEGNNLAFKAAGIPGMAFKPPAHPNCRCDTAVKRIPGTHDWVVVWYTEHDSLVCVKTVHTPWGDVDGCRGMHGIVISEGPFLGRRYSEVA